MPRHILAVMLVPGLLVACASGGTPRATFTSVPPTSPAVPVPASSRTPSTARGSLQLSGAVSGFLDVLAVTCSRPTNGVSVSLKGRVENRLYDLEIAAPSAGTFQIGSTPASVRLSSQTPDESSVSRWAAGDGQASSSGSLTISDDLGGTIDAGLQLTSGAGGAIHLRGGWSCSG